MMPNMTSFEFGDVVLVPLPFTDLEGSKKRPTVVVQPPVFGPPFKLVSGEAFSAPSAVLPKVQEVDNSELNVV